MCDTGGANHSPSPPPYRLVDGTDAGAQLSPISHQRSDTQFGESEAKMQQGEVVRGQAAGKRHSTRGVAEAGGDGARGKRWRWWRR